MNVLIIGSGAREHAFCWKLKESNKAKDIFVAPGNSGTAKIASNLSIDVLNFEELKKLSLPKVIRLI